MQARLNQDTVAGALFCACGVIGLWLSASLVVGSAASMGPGFFPRLMCWGLIGLGLIIALKGIAQGSPIEGWKLRPLLGVLGSILAFYFLLPILGLFFTVVVTVFICSAATPESRFVEVTLLAVVLAAACLFTIVYGLGLPAPAWPV